MVEITSDHQTYQWLWAFELGKVPNNKGFSSIDSTFLSRGYYFKEKFKVKKEGKYETSSITIIK